MIKNFWHQFCLVEKPSMVLGVFRLVVALTTVAHVMPSLLQLEDNYYPTAFKTFNTHFFPIHFIEWIQSSPIWLINGFVFLFLFSGFCFLIGWLSQISCIVMTLSCYYFYALNAFHIGTLSWDILLVTLFLMCLTNYHGDYFSVDCLLRKNEPEPFFRQRPIFLQRMLQMQIGLTFFYTALYKVTAQGNWIKDNPLFYIMHYPQPGITKNFLMRDFLMLYPKLCYALGLFVVTMEFLMIFLLIFRKTRMAAIYLGFIFHFGLILILDVPATFFFLFPAQLMLFIDPNDIIKWVKAKRGFYASVRMRDVIYDGRCVFCQHSVALLQKMDLFYKVRFTDLHTIQEDDGCKGPLNKDELLKRMHVVDDQGCIWSGFAAIKSVSLLLPMLWPCVPIFFFPGMSFFGEPLYGLIARYRYLIMGKSFCSGDTCFIHSNKMNEK